MSGASGDGDPPDDWRRGVRPLAKGKRIPPPSRPAPPRPKREAAAAGFEVAPRGAGVEGFAAGVDRGLRRRLRRGEIAIESTLDLHGHDRAAARGAVRQHLLAAGEAGQRCVLVVHGRGRRSADGPVLKEQLPQWLVESPLDRWVLAFTSATPGDGGSGALYVLLRRQML